MSLWIWRTSEGLAILILVKIGFPTGPDSGNAVGATGVGVGGGGGAAAAIACSCWLCGFTTRVCN